MIKRIVQTDGFRLVQFILNGVTLPLIAVIYFGMVASINANATRSKANHEEIGQIRETIAALPPRDFRLKMDRLGEQIAETNERLARVEALLERRE